MVNAFLIYIFASLLLKKVILLQYTVFSICFSLSHETFSFRSITATNYGSILDLLDR